MSEVVEHGYFGPDPALQPLRGVVEIAIRSAVDAGFVDLKLDGPAVELVRYYAQHIDAAVATGDPMLFQKAMGVSAPNLHKALTSLGLTPSARGAIKQGDEVVASNPFDELKKRRQKAAAHKKETGT